MPSAGSRLDICANSRGAASEQKTEPTRSGSFGESLTARRDFDERFADGVFPVCAFEGLADDKLDGDRGYSY